MTFARKKVKKLDPTTKTVKIKMPTKYKPGGHKKLNYRK